MSSSPATTTMPPPQPTAPLASTASSFPALAAVVYTPEQIAGAIRDLATAVQRICLFLAGPSGRAPAAPSVAASGPARLPWQPPHQVASAAIAGLRHPTLLMSWPPLDARLLQTPLSVPGPIYTAAWA